MADVENDRIFNTEGLPIQQIILTECYALCVSGKKLMVTSRDDFVAFQLGLLVCEHGVKQLINFSDLYYFQTH